MSSLIIDICTATEINNTPMKGPGTQGIWKLIISKKLENEV